MSSICDRIDAALEKVVFRGMQVRAIYLTEEDHEKLDQELNLHFGTRSAFLAYREHQIRRGETSRIYSTHGVAVAIPKRLSAKVA